MKKIIFRKQAKKDLKRIYTFCLNISPTYAEKVRLEILNYTYTLQLFPRAYPQIFSKNSLYEHRKISLDKYQIIYIVQKESIIISRIFDTRQNFKKIKIN